MPPSPVRTRFSNLMSVIFAVCRNRTPSVTNGRAGVWPVIVRPLRANAGPNKIASVNVPLVTKTVAPSPENPTAALIVGA